MDIRTRTQPAYDSRAIAARRHVTYICLDGSHRCATCADGASDLAGSRIVTLDDNPHHCDFCHARITPKGTN